MSHSVIHHMRTSAAASIPLHARALAGLDPHSLQLMTLQLRNSEISSELDSFLLALSLLEVPADTLLQKLSTYHLIELDQAVNQAWGILHDPGAKQALRHLYQLLTAHFFITYAEDTPHDTAA